MPITCLDLFSGIGAFALASKIVGGIETTQMVEINKFCQLVLRKRFPCVPVHSDIRDYFPKEGEFDLIVGGSPCQGLSIAGKQKGIIEDDRSSLWFEMLRVIQEVQPKYVVWENVFNAIRNGAVAEVMRGLHSSGYRFDAQVISAKEVGAPHLRERVFVVAYREHSNDLVAHSNCSIKANGSNVFIPWAEQIRGEIEIASNSNSFGWDLCGDIEREHGDLLHEERNSKEDLFNREERLCGVAENLGTAANSNRESELRLSEREAQEYTSIGEQSSDPVCFASRNEIKSDVCRMDDEFSSQLDWRSGTIPVCGVAAKFPDRIARLSALGNSIVPACAAIALRRVLYLDRYFMEGF
jgi:DNA (cytosine-5)-methyltransferase 1